MSPLVPRKRYLDERIVYCGNCEDNRLLCASPDGPVCSTCASRAWAYLPQAVTAQARALQAARALGSAARRLVADLSSPRLRQIVDEFSGPGLMKVVERISSSQLATVPARVR